jgi:hypothetical protein
LLAPRKYGVYDDRGMIWPSQSDARAGVGCPYMASL